MSSDQTFDVVIHAGSHRTGTSAIQRYLSQHRDQLLEQGTLYPSFAEAHYHFYLMFGRGSLDHFAVRRQGIDTKEKFETFLKEKRSDFEREIATQSFRKLILSSEDIALLGVNDLSTFKEYLKKCGAVNFNVIYYVRDHVHYTESYLSQMIKSGYYFDNKSWKKQLKKTVKYGPYLNALSDVFGQENLASKIYRRGLLKNRCIVQDFMELAGLDFTEPAEIVNASISLEMMIFLNRLNKLDQAHSDRNYAKARDTIINRWIDAGNDVFRLNGPECEIVINNCEEDARYIGEMFFDDSEVMIALCRETLTERGGLQSFLDLEKAWKVDDYFEFFSSLLEYRS